MDIEKIARKEVRKTKKKHIKETKKLELSAKKEDRQEARRNRRKKFFSFFKRRESQADLEVGIEKTADDGQPDANAIKK